MLDFFDAVRGGGRERERGSTGFINLRKVVLAKAGFSKPVGCFKLLI